MQVPVLLATVAACGSVVTSVKSGWELSRMIRKKIEMENVEEDAAYVYRKLRRAYHDGLMSREDYDKWYERYLVAKAEKDASEMRKIKVHLRIVNNGEGRRRSHTPPPPRYERGGYDGDKRRHSVTFDTYRTTHIAGGDRYEDVDRPSNGRYTEDYRDDGGRHPTSSQLTRLQRRSSVSYPRGYSTDSSRSNVERTASMSRYESPRGRRSRRHEDYDDSETYYSEKMGYHSRR